MVVVLSYLQWILKTIQIKLIHVLGGYTKDEYRILSLKRFSSGYEKDTKIGYTLGFHQGGLTVITRLMQTVINSYGCDKQTWIDTVYSDIENIYKYYAK